MGFPHSCSASIVTPATVTPGCSNPESGDHWVAVPAGSRVGHDDDQVTSLGQPADVVCPIVFGVISRASVVQVEHGVTFSAAGVIGGKQDIDVGIAACRGQWGCDARERWAGEGVGLHAAIAFVADDSRPAAWAGVVLPHAAPAPMMEAAASPPAPLKTVRRLMVCSRDTTFPGD